MIRWGIAGPGGVAARFAEAMDLVDGGQVTAVASRSMDRAEAFARTFGVPRAYDDYGALADDPDVDVVYVATPQARHMADTLMYLGAHKNVLCEKPFALNANQAQLMATAAAESEVFLMEAMWTRFLPAYRALGQILADGRIGDPLLAEGDFGFRVPTTQGHRLYDLALGGGALLDLGIYPLQLCALVFGHPDEVVASGVIGTTGVDEQVAAILRYKRGGMAIATAAIRVSTSCSARISATEGAIDIPAFMHCPDHLIVTSPSGVQRVDAAFGRGGFRFEIIEVHRCIEQGLRESGDMPLSESIALARTMDDVRRQIGLRYPEE